MFYLKMHMNFVCVLVYVYTHFTVKIKSSVQFSKNIVRDATHPAYNHLFELLKSGSVIEA